MQGTGTCAGAPHQHARTFRCVAALTVSISSPSFWNANVSGLLRRATWEKQKGAQFTHVQGGASSGTSFVPVSAPIAGFQTSTHQCRWRAPFPIQPSPSTTYHAWIGAGSEPRHRSYAAVVLQVPCTVERGGTLGRQLLRLGDQVQDLGQEAVPAAVAGCGPAQMQEQSKGQQVRLERRDGRGRGRGRGEWYTVRDKADNVWEGKPTCEKPQ